MAPRSRIGIGGLCVVSCLFSYNIAQDCPSYTKNRDSTGVFPIGVPAELPDGFVLFRINTSFGLYRSPLSSYEPALVPGTEGDNPHSISVSDDGRWVFYIDKEGENEGVFVVQRLNGTGRVESWRWGSTVGGFYRRSPKGSEVFYLNDDGTARAAQVDLTGQNAVLINGTERTLADLGWRRSFNNVFSGSTVIVGDQIFGRENGYNSYSFFGRTAFITIPDSGNGTAGPEDIFQWANDDTMAVWGCGHTMSHDGAFCVANASLIGTACSAGGNGGLCVAKDGTIGGIGCIPNRRSVLLHDVGAYVDTQHFDHKGFYVTRFWRTGDPPVGIDAIIDSHGISINWAPPRYRRGEFDEVDFTSWNFSNDSRFVAGVLKGARLRDLDLENGIWIVEWPTNTWTRITPDTLTLEVDDPAVFITNPGAIGELRKPSSLIPPARREVLVCPVGNRAMVAVPAWAASAVVYTLDGRELWRFSRGRETGVRRVGVDVPFAAGRMLVVRYEEPVSTRH